MSIYETVVNKVQELYTVVFFGLSCCLAKAGTYVKSPTISSACHGLGRFRSIQTGRALTTMIVDG
jgi:hypothetical protein